MLLGLEYWFGCLPEAHILKAWPSKSSVYVNGLEYKFNPIMGWKAGLWEAIILLWWGPWLSHWATKKWISVLPVSFYFLACHVIFLHMSCHLLPSLDFRQMRPPDLGQRIYKTGSQIKSPSVMVSRQLDMNGGRMYCEVSRPFCIITTQKLQGWQMSQKKQPTVSHIITLINPRLTTVSLVL